MTFRQIKNNPIMFSARIAEAMKDENTLDYVNECLRAFMGGSFGEIGEEDTEANLAEVEQGEGRCVAHYKKMHRLTGDFYIIADFSESMPGEDSNHTSIFYCDEY